MVRQGRAGCWVGRDRIGQNRNEVGQCEQGRGQGRLRDTGHSDTVDGRAELKAGLMKPFYTFFHLFPHLILHETAFFFWDAVI